MSAVICQHGRRLIEELVKRSPYKLAKGTTDVTECVHCHGLFDAAVKPKVHDHSVTCVWAAGMETIGHGND